MADNVRLNPGTGGDAVAADEISSVKYQRIKLVHGADGVNAGDISQANPLPVSEFFHEVSLGNITGHSFAQVDGFNADLDTGIEGVWDAGGAYAGFVAAAEALSVVSGSVNDAAAGTGARTILVEGLNASYVAVSESFTLNGNTPVIGAVSFLRVLRMTVQTAGSGGVNAGAITCVGNGSGAVFFQAIAGSNASQIGAYTIPAGKTGLLYHVHFGAAKNATEAVMGQLWIRPFGKVFYRRSNFVSGTLGGGASVNYTPPIVLNEKTDFRFDATATGDNNSVCVRAGLMLVDAGA